MLRVHSVFRSISGECSPAFPQGTQATFVRLQGCNLKCSYCDTRRGWDIKGGFQSSVEDLLLRIRSMNRSRIVITGGEPLLQDGDDLFHLLLELNKMGMSLSVETNGSIPISWRMADLVQGWVVDYKLPGSGQEMKMLSPAEMIESFPWSSSIFKFVCLDESDFKRALEIRKEMIRAGERLLGSMIRLRFAFSAALPLKPEELFYLMEEEDLTGDILNVQIHKWVFPGGENEK